MKRSDQRVLLVGTPHGRRRQQPLGVAYVAAALRQREVPVQILCTANAGPLDDARLMELAAPFHPLNLNQRWCLAHP